MSRWRKASVLAWITAAVAVAWTPVPAAQAPRGAGRVAAFAAGSAQDLRQWDPIAESMLRSGELRVRQVRQDTQLSGRRVERADQYYRGVRVFGADISRQMDDRGVVLSMFGHLYTGIDIAPNPTLTADAVKVTVTELAALQQAADNQPELVVLPIDDGATFRLAWRMRAVTDRADIVQYFLDALTGTVLRQYSDRQTQSTVGRAVGVLGDSKKISVTGAAGSFTARDLLRPPLVETDDMRGDPIRTLNYLDGQIALGPSDIAADTDNNWTDGAVNDAHVYAGYTYDYYFKRFGRLDADIEQAHEREGALSVNQIF